MKKSKLYEKTVKNAYTLLVTYRRSLEEAGEEEAAAEVENVYKMLWTECLNEEPPWCGDPAVERGGGR